MEGIPIISISSSEDEKQGEEEAGKCVTAHRYREEYRLLSDLSGFENLRALVEGEALMKKKKRRRKKPGEMRDSEFRKVADLTGFENLRALIEGETQVKMGKRKNEKDVAFSRSEVEGERDMEFRMVYDPPGFENLRALSEGETLMKMSKGMRRRKRKKDVFAKAEKKRRDVEYMMLSDLSGFENLKALIEGEALIKRKRRGDEEKRDSEFHAPEKISVAAIMERETVEMKEDEISEAESLEILERIPEEFTQSSVIVVMSSEEEREGEKEDEEEGAIGKASGMITNQNGLGSFTAIMEKEALSKKRTRRRRRKKKNNNFDAQQQLPVDAKEVDMLEEHKDAEKVTSSVARPIVNTVLRKLLRKPRYFDPPDSSWNRCQKCGEDHETTNCILQKKKPKPCHLCGSLNHNWKHCIKVQNHLSYTGRANHDNFLPEQAQENNFDFITCLRCGNVGHDMFSCRSDHCPDDIKDIQCYVCKSFGHLCCVNVPDASPREVSCYYCGQSGHLGDDCEKLKRIKKRPFSCYRCGGEGHFARNCTLSGKLPGTEKRIRLSPGTSSAPLKLSMPQ